ncbi:MAG: ERCC4 domain-containing protein [Clostridium sp.]
MKKNIDKILDTITIIVDSREKSNDHILSVFNQYKIPYKVEGLKFGDYSAFIPKNEKLGITEDYYFTDIISIERKNSLNEIGGNLSTNRARFKRELTRVKDGYLIIMIEGNTYKDIIYKNYKNKLEPNSFLGSMHGLWSEFKYPFVFIDKDASAVFIQKTLHYFIRNKLKNI